MQPQIKQAKPWQHPLAVALYLLVFVWGVIPLIPEESGFRFGIGYRIFFTVMIVWGGLFFLLLRRERFNVPSTTGGVLLSILGVYLAAIAFPVVMGSVYPRPQLAIPKPGEEGAATPEERGKQLFFGEGMETVQPHCALCHQHGGKGGTRGPALDDVAANAAKRKPGTDPKEYVREHILKGSQYFTVPGYDPMMPGYEGRISDEQLDALLTFLFGEGGEAAAAGSPEPAAAAEEAAPAASPAKEAAPAAAPAKETAPAAKAAAPAAVAGDVVRIELKDYEFAPADVKVKAKNGEVHFLWENTSTHAHNYRIVDKGGNIVYPGPKVGAKKKREENIKLAPGEYEVFCNLSDHEERGMKGTLIVD